MRTYVNAHLTQQTSTKALVHRAKTVLLDNLGGHSNLQAEERLKVSVSFP